MRSTGPLSTNTRHKQPVHKTAPVNGDEIKIGYVVPVDKVFFVEWWSVCIEEGTKMILALDGDGTVFDCIGNGQSKTGGDSHNFPPFSPLGPIPAGVTVNLIRVSGMAESWGGSFIGYLEDV